ncbi:MAG: hypothetical protein AB9880_03650 [Christensenellales bacterium]
MKHNPYGGVTVSTALQTKSFSHMHTRAQENFDVAYALGFRHFPGVHYQPSSPTYPLSSFYASVPGDVLGAPNSEKVEFSNASVHINALGSTYSSPGHNWDIPTDGPYLTWQEKFDNIFAALQFANGGGITINHSTNYTEICKMLDYDDRVLGMEIYNNSAVVGEGVNYDAYLSIWDRVLKTGRRCFGFCVVDWPIDAYEPLYGSSMLLTDAFTEQALLEAYRDGAFYGIINDTGLRFTELSATDSLVTVGVNRSSTINFITERGVTKAVTGTSATYDVSGNTFVRVDVLESGWSRMFSNPFMFKDVGDMKPILARQERRRKAMALA